MPADDAGGEDPPDFARETGSPDYEESFERATPADPATLLRGRESDEFAPGSAGSGEAPPLEVAVERIPLATRNLVAELFKTGFTSVRKIPRENLR